ncbi:NADH-quinone oxidoreductase subunit NuoG [Roseibium sp. SCP14]|uniref:NADH-quinone oxidoreductase subunit NuoG n=1 Tax=Roseibium sp. SCP14 TaxID=3141375 RepID=UPI003339E91F
MANITIDGIELEVPDGTLILEAARSLDIDVPTFCYQKRFAPLASCRMCLVSVENSPKMQPACATPVADGMVVHTASEQVAQTRQSMLELLLANHPLDCPVCDKGGECELQDMVFKYGAGTSRFRDEKRVFRSRDLSLNQVIIFNANRCIQCQRCVRMCEDVVGAVALGTIEKGMDSEITGFENSLTGCDHCGNCIEVCPVGALMSQPYRYKARPWDLVETETTCSFCGTGCQLTVSTREGQLARVKSKYETGVNGETLCVKGRFGIDFINSENRIETPWARRSGALEPVSWDEAYELMRHRLGQPDQIEGHRIGGLASAHLTNETLYLFQKMLRTVFRTNNIDSSSRWVSGVYDVLPGLVGDLYTRQSLENTVSADAIFAIGSNITDDNPVTDYLLRSKVRQHGNKLFLASVRPSRLDADAQAHLRLLPGDEAIMISAVAEMVSSSPEKEPPPAAAPFAEFTRKIASTLKASNTSSVSVLVGMEILRATNAGQALQWLERLLRNLQQAGKQVSLQFLFDRCNQFGAWEMGVQPNHLPGWRRPGDVRVSEVWQAQLPPEPGVDVHEMLQRCANGTTSCLYLLGSDPVSTYPDRSLVEKAMSSAGFVIAQASHHSETTQLADIILPGAAFGEETGTMTNNEGRMQLSREFRPPIGNARRNSDILNQIAEVLGHKLSGSKLEDTFAEIAQLVPSLEGMSLADIGDEGLLCTSQGQTEDGQFKELPLPSRVDRSWNSNGKLTLVTGESRFHASYVTEHSATLSSISSQAYVEIADTVCQELGLKTGELVTLRSPHGETTLQVKTNRQFPPGLAFVPENFARQRLNELFKNGEYSSPVDIIPNEV